MSTSSSTLPSSSSPLPSLHKRAPPAGNAPPLVRLAPSPRAEAGSRAAATGAAASSRSADFLNELSVFQQVQRECGLSDVDGCVRRFRALYAGKQSYSDHALKLQFASMRSDERGQSGGVVDLTDSKTTATTRAHTPTQETPPTSGTIKLSGGGSQQPLVGDADEQQTKKRRLIKQAENEKREAKYDSTRIDSDDSDSGDDGQAEREDPYEPLSPIATASTGWPHLRSSVAAVQGSYSADDVRGASAALTALSTSGTASADDALVERVAEALVQRRRHAAAVRRQRQDQLREERRARWSQQCRAYAGRIGRSVYHGVTAAVCGYGLMHAAASAYPVQVEQAVVMAQQHVRAILTNVSGGQ